MGCHYPSCMMGGGHCPYERKCDEESEKAYLISEEKRLLDLEEQKLRIEHLKRNLETPPRKGK